MRRVHSYVAGLLLVASAAASAGVEPYPEAVIGTTVSTRTRAEVIAELHEAIRQGRVSEFPYRYVDRQAYAEQQAQAAGNAQADTRVETGPDGKVVVWGEARLMRVKIQAEAAEANRLGLLSVGEGNPPVATPEQEALIAVAGRRAIERYQIVGSL